MMFSLGLLAGGWTTDAHYVIEGNGQLAYWPGSFYLSPHVNRDVGKSRADGIMWARDLYLMDTDRYDDPQVRLPPQVFANFGIPT